MSDPEPTPEPQLKKKLKPADPPSDKDDTPPKLQLTEEELETRIKSRLDAAQLKRDEADRKAKEDHDAEEAKKRGEFEKVAEGEKVKRETAERERDVSRLDKRKLEVKDRLRDYLAEKHPTYAASVKWIMPAIEFDLSTEDKEIDKRISAAADAYVKDNPRQLGPGGAPAHTGRGQRAVEGEKVKQTEDSNNNERPLSRTARMAF